jgi:hypothetical protein
MALFGPRKDDSDLGDVGAAINHVRQMAKDKARLKSFIREYGERCADGRIEAAMRIRSKIFKMIDKYM